MTAGVRVVRRAGGAIGTVLQVHGNRITVQWRHGETPSDEAREDLVVVVDA